MKQQLFILLICYPLQAEASRWVDLKHLWSLQEVQGFLQFPVFQVVVWKWLAILLGLFISRFFIKLFLAFTLNTLDRISKKTAMKWDDLAIDAFKPSAGWLLGCLFWFLWLNLLQIPDRPMFFFLFLIKLAFCFALLMCFYRLTDVFVHFLSQWMTTRKLLFSKQMEYTLKRVFKVLVVVLGILATLQNLGINVVSLMAGLGLGGLAFALAAKDMCSHFFGSVMIFLDQPFKVGDWVLIGDVEGTIEDIGFRSTRIRTFYDSVVSIPNGGLSNMNIDNMGRRKYRRMKAFYALTYNTPPHKIEDFIEGIKHIIKTHPQTRKDYFHVVFNSYEASSLDIMLYCFVEVPTWGIELKAKQDIHLEILKLAEKLSVEFAFPTRSLYLHKQPTIDSKKDSQSTLSSK